MQHVTIVGAGAMGCLFAARLARSGADVTLIDVDAARLAVLNRDGIELNDDAGSHTIAVRAVTADAASGAADLILLLTKGMHSAAAIRSVAHLRGPGTVVLTLQNGLGNAEAIAEVFPEAAILIGMTDFPADFTPPNHVASHGHGHIHIGGFVATANAHAAAVAALLNHAGLNCAVDPHILVPVWEKVAFNAALNPLSTITGLPVGGLNTVEGRRIAAAVIGEVVATASAHGVLLDRARIDAKVDWALANHAAHQPSMLQDRLAGRPTEIETINGAVVRAAQAKGVPTQAIAMLADLVRMGEPPRRAP